MMLPGTVDKQYLIELNKMFVGYRNHTPLIIVNHFYAQWFKVTNVEKTVATEAFSFPWADISDMHIRSYALKLNERQRQMKKMSVPCNDDAKVITYVNTTNKSGIFKEEELLKWENL